MLCCLRTSLDCLFALPQDVGNDLLLGAIVQVKSTDVAAQRAKRFDELADDSVLIGVHRPDLIPHFSFKNWQSAHFIILAETSTKHAQALKKALESLQQDGKDHPSLDEHTILLVSELESPISDKHKEVAAEEKAEAA